MRRLGDEQAAIVGAEVERRVGRAAAAALGRPAARRRATGAPVRRPSDRPVTCRRKSFLLIRHRHDPCPLDGRGRASARAESSNDVAALPRARRHYPGTACRPAGQRAGDDRFECCARRLLGRGLGVQALAPARELVQGAEIGLGGGDERVGVGAARPVTLRPSAERRTETSACASVPSVTACTW